MGSIPAGRAKLPTGLRKAAPFFWASGNSGAGASHLRVMIGVYREFEGCMRLMGHVLRRLRVLALPPVTEALTRQIYFTGASATAGMVLRGAFLGTLIIAYVIDVLEANSALAVKILLWVVLREIGPLMAAVLVIQRSGTAIATELALMQISGEVASLRRMRIGTIWSCPGSWAWPCPRRDSLFTCR